MLQQFSFCPKHIHVYDLIFTLGHKSVHVYTFGCSKRTCTHKGHTNVCVCQGGPAFVVYFQGCWFFCELYFCYCPGRHGNQFSGQFEKIAFERTLEDMFALLVCFYLFFRRNTLPSNLKIHKIQIKANNFDLAGCKIRPIRFPNLFHSIKWGVENGWKMVGEVWAGAGEQEAA